MGILLSIVFLPNGILLYFARKCFLNVNFLEQKSFSLSLSSITQKIRNHAGKQIHKYEVIGYKNATNGKVYYNKEHLVLKQ